MKTFKNITNISILLLLIISLISCSNKSDENQRHLGTWNHEFSHFSYTFDTSGHAVISYIDTASEYKSMVKESGMELKYKIDYTKTPITLDIFYCAKFNDDTIPERIFDCQKNIIRFINDDTMEMRTSDLDYIRPESFDTSESEDVLITFGSVSTHLKIKSPHDFILTRVK